MTSDHTVRKVQVMDVETANELLLAGEGQSVEYKRGFTSEIGSTMSAFANTNHGVIFVGVADDGTVKGISPTVEERVAGLAHSCRPPLHPRIYSLDLGGKCVLIIEVEHGQEEFHSFRNIAYRRVGSTDVPLPPQHVLQLASERRAALFDAQICAETDLDGIDSTKVQHFLDAASGVRRLAVEGRLSKADALDKLGLLNRAGITNAAVLLFGCEPQHAFLQSEVRCARFKGTEPITFVDMKVISGTLPEQIDETEKFVMNNTALSAAVHGFERVEEWEYPLGAVREAVTNAICHRDYTSTANVQLSIFDDRLEVWNPGGLPESLTVDDLRRVHPSKPRNPLIANVLFLVKYIERWGTGTQRIIEEARQHGLPEPEFSERQGGFSVVFRKLSAVLGRLNERQRSALSWFKDEGRITRSKYAEHFRCSPRTAARDLDGLVEKGLVSRTGAGRTTSYSIASA